jgi:hypothetical protein
MGDVMLFGVLRMPYEMAMVDELSRRQFWGRAQQAADEITTLRADNERLRAALEWALDNAGADHPSYPYRVPDDVWAKPYLVTGDCGGVGEEHFATALEAVEAAIAQEPKA